MLISSSLPQRNTHTQLSILHIRIKSPGQYSYGKKAVRECSEPKTRERERETLVVNRNAVGVVISLAFERLGLDGGITNGLANQAAPAKDCKANK